MSVFIHIENFNVTASDLATIVQQELFDETSDEASPAVAKDMAHHGVPGATEPVIAATEQQEARYVPIMERFEQDAVAATARRNFLRNVVSHADPARKLEGFQTNHQRRPKIPGQVDAKEHSELTMARESLERACASCALSASCRLSNDLDRWLDVHPYKDGPAGRRRPGSLLPPGATESRTSLLRALKQDPLAHCDPRQRSAAAKS